MSNKEKTFQSAHQTAIFNFLIMLIMEYRNSMSPEQAVEKACLWLISLAEEVKATSSNIIETDATKHESILDETTDTKDTE